MIINNTDAAWVEEVVKKVINKRTEQNITIDDYDLDRIYITWDEEEYDIRMWTIHPCGGNKYKIPTTLFKMIPDENGAHGEAIREVTVIVTK